MTNGKVILLAVFIALPSTANAWSWWSGWDSYKECIDYYTKNPARGSKHYGYRYLAPEESCLSIKLDEERKQHAQAEINRVLILGCRADSITEAQFEACVALAMPERH